jgi:hypothetical protein
LFDTHRDNRLPVAAPTRTATRDPTSSFGIEDGGDLMARICERMLQAGVPVVDISTW